MGSPWGTHETPWAPHGASWGAHGVPMGAQGAPMEPHGVPRGSPWASKAQNLDFPYVFQWLEPETLIFFKFFKG